MSARTCASGFSARRRMLVRDESRREPAVLGTAIPDREPRTTIEAARQAFGRGDISAAEQICAEILSRDANDWAAWALLAETELERGRNDAAIVSAERSARLASGNPIPLI